MIVGTHYIDYHNTHLFCSHSIVYSYQTQIKVSTCCFQNMMQFNMIVGTHCIDHHNTHLFHLHIPFCIHIDSMCGPNTKFGDTCIFHISTSTASIILKYGLFYSE